MKAAAALLAAALLFGVPLRGAANAGPQSVALAQLKDGRLLHNARILEIEGRFVVLRSDEGLTKVAATDLPAVLADEVNAAPALAPAPSKPDYVMEWFDPNQGPAVPAAAPGEKPAKPAQGPMKAEAAQAGAAYLGCRIESFQPKEIQGVLGCAEVVIQNETDQNVQIRPGMLVCLTERGAHLPGRYFFAETLPLAVRRRELVPAHGQVTEVVTFTNDALAIESIRWMR